MDPGEHLVGTRALNTLSRELLGHLIQLTVNELILLFLAHLEVVLLLQCLDHAAEVHANEALEKAIYGVCFVDVVFLHDLVGEVGASPEGKTLGLAESVVAVQEDILDLRKR